MIDQAPEAWHDPAPGRRYGEPYAAQAVAQSSNAIRSFWRGILIGFLGIGGIVALAVAVVVLA